MQNVLLISVRLHEGWYHGTGQTPSPARLFQALVAGAGLSGPLTPETVKALEWLERQAAPVTAAPVVTRGQPVVNFVPNNDLDAKHGDHRRIGEIRTKKLICPILFDPQTPFLFAWHFNEDAEHRAQQVCELAEGIFQFGRTVDIAWAWAELLSKNEFDDRLRNYHGVVRYPAIATGDVDCAMPGSLASLHQRYADASQRFAIARDANGQTFRRRSKPIWQKVSYGISITRTCFELRTSGDAGFAIWPLEHAASLIEAVRDGAAERLRRTLGDRVSEIDQSLVGRKPNGENAGPTSARVRLIPLPSIGHPQADMQIRRVLVEVPGECLLRADDIAWAISGLRLEHPIHCEAIDVTHTNDDRHLSHFGIENEPSRIWRSVTPLALPDASRRRIDSRRKRDEAKAGHEKQQEQHQAVAAVSHALRHANVQTQFVTARVQREPFDVRGSRVEGFAEKTRFSKHALWHVELEFESPLAGPLVLGNGRFLGLGILRPVRQPNGVFALAVDAGLRSGADPVVVAKSLRRAVMSRVRDLTGPNLPTFFSGHEADGAPADSSIHPHLAFAFDAPRSRLMVVAPHVADRRSPTPFEAKYIATLETALTQLTEVRAGEAGHLQLSPQPVDVETDEVFAPALVWESVTPYVVTRHARQKSPKQILIDDVRAECQRRGLRVPSVTVLEYHGESRIGLTGRLRLTFKSAIPGPIMLGRSRHIGGGLFQCQPGTTACGTLD